MRGVNIFQDDPVSGTWNVIVISAHYASMLAAKARPSEVGTEPTFDFIFTYDRDVIVECAQALMLRIARLGNALDDWTVAVAELRNAGAPGRRRAA